jgi:hypothetical protein
VTARATDDTTRAFFTATPARDPERGAPAA